MRSWIPWTKLTFTFYDIKEISAKAYYVFVGEFRLDSNSVPDKSDSDLSNFDPDDFGCVKISSEVENFVETNWKECDPLDEIYGTTTSDVIKKSSKDSKRRESMRWDKFFYLY